MLMTVSDTDGKSYPETRLSEETVNSAALMASWGTFSTTVRTLSSHFVTINAATTYPLLKIKKRQLETRSTSDQPPKARRASYRR